MGLLYGENFVILASTVFDWFTRVTDGRMDGQAIAYARYTIYAVARKVAHFLVFWHTDSTTSIVLHDWGCCNVAERFLLRCHQSWIRVILKVYSTLAANHTWMLELVPVRDQISPK